MKIKILRKIIKRVNYKSQKGTTLVELLVSLSVFSIFITVAIGGFVQALTNQRIVLKLVAATDNMSMVLEQMAREMRVGTKFYTSTNPNQIQFDWPDASGMKQITYKLDENQKAIVRTVQPLDNNGNPSGQPASDLITANNVNVSYFNAKVFSSHNPGPCLVRLVVGMTASDRGVSVTNYIQSSVSSRVFGSACQNN